jgi:hypothetical protein
MVRLGRGFSPRPLCHGLPERGLEQEIGRKHMSRLLTTIAIAAAMAVAVAPLANAAHKSMHHHAHHAKGGCKGEFMYMKGGKCMDARAKA